MKLSPTIIKRLCRIKTQKHFGNDLLERAFGGRSALVMQALQ